MNYQIKLEKEYIAKLENEEKYIELINLYLDEIRYNYQIIESENKSIEELTEIYEAISFLGNNKALKKQTLINILDFLRINRDVFIEKFNQYYN